jgi:hypothetical protein
MARVIKSEWHSVEKRYSLDIDEVVVAEVYPDMNEDEVEARLKEIESGDYSVDEFLSDAESEGIDFDWDWLDEDDWWTDRKGGYDVTYELE